MKNFIRAYTFTLVPMAIVLISALSIYYATQFSLNKSISLGTLQGFIASIILNFIPAFLMLDRFDNKPKVQKVQKKSQEEKIDGLSTEHSLYLLLDCEKTFDLIINSILKQYLGTILSHDKHRGFLSARTLHQTINFEIKKLTRHTSKIEIKAQKANKTLKSILTYIKDKEKAYLQY